jgi:hypothetical protein
LSESVVLGKNAAMLYQHQALKFRLLASILAMAAVLVFLFSGPSGHPPALHMAAASSDVSAHSHSHGDHSHDDFDVSVEEGQDGDHHHADHSHEKAGMAQSGRIALPDALDIKYRVRFDSLPGHPPEGIDRPPRSMA